jgi:hypothetical protein
MFLRGLKVLIFLHMYTSEFKATADEFSESNIATVDPVLAEQERWEDCYPAGFVVGIS